MARHLVSNRTDIGMLEAIYKNQVIHPELLPAKKSFVNAAPTSRWSPTAILLAAEKQLTHLYQASG